MNSSLLSHVNPTVWRLHAKQEAHIRIDDRCQFLIEEGIAGVGWGIDAEGPIDWDEYCQQAGSVDSNVNALKNAMVGDLIWTRDRKGIYFLGRLTGDWEYRFGSSYDLADIHNVRACTWHRIGSFVDVPGSVRNAFRPRRTCQRINSDTVLKFSVSIYNSATNQEIFKRSSLQQTDLFALLSPDDCEDIVGIYLQLQGWLIYPGTCKTDSLLFEFAMHQPTTGKNAAVQVKQGQTFIQVQDYEGFPGDVFLFQTNGNYIGEPKKNTTVLLQPDEIRDFAFKYRKLMPANVQYWMAWIYDEDQACCQEARRLNARSDLAISGNCG